MEHEPKDRIDRPGRIQKGPQFSPGERVNVVDARATAPLQVDERADRDQPIPGRSLQDQPEGHEAHVDGPVAEPPLGPSRRSARLALGHDEALDGRRGQVRNGAGAEERNEMALDEAPVVAECRGPDLMESRIVGQPSPGDLLE
jgi:hypothetical protein